MDQKIIKAENDKNGLIITGLEAGSTTVYIWKNNEILTYIINVHYGKVNLAIINSQNRNLDYGKLSYGYIKNNFINKSSDKNLFENSTLGNYFQYYFPFYEGKINTVFSNFGNFVNNLNISSDYIDNFIINYTDKNIQIDFGDISNPVGGGFIGNFNNRGVKFNYNDNSKIVTLFGSIPKDSLYLYKKDVLASEHNRFDYYGNIGSTLNYNFNNKLSLFTSFQVNLLKDSNKVKNDVLMTFNYKEPNIFALESQIGTNFSKINNYTKFNYHNEWGKMKEFVDLTLEYRKIPEGITNFEHYDQDIYSICLNGMNYSKIFLNINDSLQNTNNSFKNIFTTQISKQVSEKISLNTNYSFTNFLDNQYNTFQFICNSNYFIPLSISYSYSQGINLVDFQSNRTALSLFLLNTSNFNILSNIFYESKKEFLTNLNKNLNLVSLNFSANLILNKYFSAKSDFYYNYSLEKSDQLIKFQKIVFANGFDYKISDYNYLNLNFSINSDFLGNKIDTSINTLLGYTYYFGDRLYARETKGSIKGVVFEDNNNNEIFDVGEKTFNDVEIEVKGNTYKTTSNGYRVDGLEYDTYIIVLNKKTLPAGYKFIGSDSESIMLNDKEKIVNLPITNKNRLHGVVYKNKNRIYGLDGVKVILDGKYEYETDSDGYFSFITEIGEHIVKVDPFTAPKNYSVEGKISKKIIVKKGNENSVDFTFFPIITFKGRLLDLKNNRPVPNIELKINFNFNSKISTKTIKSNENGEFFIRNLEEGELEILSDRMKNTFRIKITDEPQNIKQDIYLDF